MKFKAGPDFWIAFGLFWFAWLPVVWTTGDIGITYDEPIYAGASLKIAEWARRAVSREGGACPFSREMIAHYWSAKDMQPPALKYVTALSLIMLTPVVGYLPAVRGGAALLFALCVAVIFLWGTRAFSRRVGVFGACAFLLMPCVWGHAHLTALDVPVAAMTLFMVYAAWRLAEAPHIRGMLFSGLVAGVALATKMNAAIVYPVLLLWSAWRGRRVFAHTALSLLVVAPLVFYIIWPWLWLDPLGHLRDYLSFQLKHYPIGVSYFGKVYVIPPWHYPFVMTAITTPVVILLLGIVGGCIALAGPKERRRSGILILSCFLMPLLVFAMPGVPKYNGTRLFLSAFPFLALLAGVGFEAVTKPVVSWSLRGERDPVRAQKSSVQLTLLAAALCLLPGLRAIITMHPFELSYYNSIVGGLRGAVKRGLEPTYWGDTYFHTLNFLNRRAPAGATINISPPGVVSYMRMYQNSGALRADLRLSGGDENVADADYVVFHCRQSEMSETTKALFEDGKPVYTVRCQGVPLAVVYDRSMFVNHIQKANGNTQR